SPRHGLHLHVHARRPDGGGLPGGLRGDPRRRRAPPRTQGRGGGGPRARPARRAGEGRRGHQLPGGRQHDARGVSPLGADGRGDRRGPAARRHGRRAHPGDRRRAGRRLLPVSRPAGGAPHAPGRSPGGHRPRLPAVRPARVRGRRPPRLSRDRGGAARPGAGGPGGHARAPGRRREREHPGAGPGAPCRRGRRLHGRLGGLRRVVLAAQGPARLAAAGHPGGEPVARARLGPSPVSVDTLRALLAGRCPDPDGPGMLAVPTRSVVIAPGLARDAGSLVGALGLGRRLAVVSDAITHEVLGAAIARAVASIAEVILAVLPAGVHGDAAAVEDVRGATRRADGLIAVGSGTLNDLCKYAAALDRKPYAVFGTAPSMNGYTSVSAAITMDGLKRSLPAVAACGVFLDVDVLARAPLRLIRAGLGDSLCRPTAQADWLLAHLLHDHPYREAPFALLAGEEDALLEAPGAL